VSSAGFITGLPMVMTGGIWAVEVPGEPVVPGVKPMASLRFVTPGALDALGIAVRAGRDVGAADTPQAPFVAVVSESFAQRHWPGQDPLGRTFKMATKDRTVVGVVGDVRVRGLERNSEPQVYLPYRQVDDGSIIGYIPRSLVIRSSLDTGALLPSVRGIVASADPQLPLFDVRMLSDVVAADTAPRSVQARVLAGFAATAILLAAIGLHGLLAFTVSQRQQEIGVRLALGARPADILRLILRQGLILAAIGVGVGVAIAYAAGRGVQALLAGVSPADPATFLAALAIALLMAAAGSAWPALRAARLDPLAVMRVE
jgi:predicted permease